MKIPFVGQSYQSYSKRINQQRAINLFPVVDQNNGRTVAAMYGTPGLTHFCDLGGAKVRGIINTGRRLCAVCDDTFYNIEVSNSGKQDSLYFPSVNEDGRYMTFEVVAKSTDSLGNVTTIATSEKSYHEMNTSIGSPSEQGVYIQVADGGNDQLVTVQYLVNDGSGNSDTAILTTIPRYEFFAGIQTIDSTIGGDALEITFTPKSLGYPTAVTGVTITGDDLVSMADNGKQIFISTHDGNGFIYDYNATPESLTAITDTDYTDTNGSGVVGFIDGYFVYVELDSQKFWITGFPVDIGSGDIVEGLDYASAETGPDDLVSLIVDHRELWLFGEETTEVWTNTGEASFPFRRYPEGILEIGCAAKHSPAKMDNTVFWLTPQRTVVRADGYTPQIISTDSISEEIRKLFRVDDALGFVYSSLGHAFYVLTFPTDRRTFVYDAATGMWHEWQSHGDTRHLSDSCVRMGVDYIVGGENDGKLYLIDAGAYTEDGRNITRKRITPFVHGGGKRVKIDRLEILFESGVGNLFTDPTEEAEVMLKWSDDWGHTWSTERWAVLGNQGENTKRAVWRRLGTFRERIFELSISDPVKVVILEATADVQPMRN